MGILFVLIFWAVALTILATASAALLIVGTWLFLRPIHKPHKRWIIAAASFPFLCVAYAGCWFVAYATINQVVFHHDPMIGDDWYTPLGNGYAIDMIDVTDQGIIHPGDDLNSPAGIDGVRRLQVVGPLIYGTQDSQGFQHLGQETHAEDKYFLLDTATHTFRFLPSESDLALSARSHGTTLALQPIAEVYSHFRFIWFDKLAFAALFLLPAAAFALLLFRLLQVRRPATGDS